MRPDRPWQWGLVAGAGTCAFFSFFGLFDPDLPLVWVGWGIMLGTYVALGFFAASFFDWINRRRRR